jgi:predicted trehalose synthase
MSRDKDELQAILDSLDASLDQVLRQMDRWEEELHRTMRKRDHDEVVEVAREGGTFAGKARAAEDELLAAKGQYKEDLSDGHLEKAQAAVQAKLDRIDARLQKAQDELAEMQEGLDQKMQKHYEAMEGLSDPGLYPEDDEEMRKMKEKFKKEQKERQG